MLGTGRGRELRIQAHAEVGQGEHRATSPAMLVPNMLQVSSLGSQGDCECCGRLCPFRNSGVWGPAICFNFTGIQINLRIPSSIIAIYSVPMLPVDSMENSVLLTFIFSVNKSRHGLQRKVWRW